jgi:hypothetical protein
LMIGQISTDREREYLRLSFKEMWISILIKIIKNISSRHETENKFQRSPFQYKAKMCQSQMRETFLSECPCHMSFTCLCQKEKEVDYIFLHQTKVAKKCEMILSNGI